MSDEYGVIRTLHSYCHALDEHDLDWLMTLFAEDCVFQVRGQTNEVVRVEGKPAIRDVYAALTVPREELDETLQAWNRDSQLGKHACLNPIVRIDGDRAWSQADWVALQVIGPPTGEGVVTRVAGKWHDQLRRVDGRWLFTHRGIMTQLPGISDPMVIKTPPEYR